MVVVHNLYLLCTNSTHTEWHSLQFRVKVEWSVFIDSDHLLLTSTHTIYFTQQVCTSLWLHTTGGLLKT